MSTNQRTRCMLWAALICCGHVALASCEDTAAPTRACTAPLSDHVAIPMHSHVYADVSLQGMEGWVIDPAPLSRGEHAVQRFWRETDSCDWRGGWYGWGPPPPSTQQTEAPPMHGSPTTEGARVRALLLMGADPGAVEDAWAWVSAAESLGAVYELHIGPDRTAVHDALARTCLGANSQDTVLVVATGRGSPAGGGSLVLGTEAVSYDALFAHLAEACLSAGLLVTVMDSSYVPRMDDGWPPEQAPLIAWRGSDASVPDALRKQVAAGGLLTGALTGHLQAVATQDCLTVGDATPHDTARLFQDKEAVLNRMEQLRWSEYGARRRAGRTDAADAPGQRPAATQLIALPTGMLHTVGTVSTDGACAQNDDCWERATQCSLASCRRLACVEGRCLAVVADSWPCDDGTPCTTDDRCDALGLCRGVSVDCDDGKGCTTDTCLYDEGCVHTPHAGAACDDQDLCTLLDRCGADGGCIGAPIDCDDGNPCTTNWCDPTAGCIAETSHANCDDGSACTTPDYCEDGLCRGAPLACVDGDPCTADACDPDTGCLHPPLPEGFPCDDGDGCTGEDRCLEGACIGLESICDDGWDCTLDSCEGGLCTHLPEPGTCITDEGCIPVGEHPANHPCVVCAETNVLTADPLVEGVDCPDDGISCTLDLCADGHCVHTNTPGTCHGPDGVCVTVGEAITPCLTCVDTGVGTPVAQGTPCDDGKGCTVDDTCNPTGACAGAHIPCCPVVTDLVCNGLVESTTAGGLGSPAVSDWSCLPTAYPASERAHHFRAPCDGEVIFSLEGQPGQLLFLIRGPPSHAQTPATQCLTGQCDTYTSAGLTQWMFHDQEYMLVVDGLAGSEGPYSLEVICNCPQPTP